MADLALGYRPDGALIDASMEIASRGITSMLTAYGGTLRSTCRLAGERLVSAHHTAAFKSRRYTRDIEISYDANGDPVDVTVLKRGIPQSVNIPRDMWQGTVDPLTGILRIRRWMVAADRSEQVVVPIFDGRSRYDIHATPMPNEGDAARAKLVIQPLAAASRSSWLYDWGDEEGRWIEAQVSADQRAVPLLMETQGGGTSSSVRLDRDCSGAAACS